MTSNLPPDDITIEPFDPATLHDISRMLARAFVTNPLHEMVLGKGRLDRNEKFFALALPVMRGEKFVARNSGGIVGFVHWVASPGCRYGGAEKLRMTAAVIGGLGIGVAKAMGEWFAAWEGNDPDEPHVHLGPIGVAPEAQGTGVGRALMERYTAELDRAGRTGWLETDRPANVRFYERSGFVLVSDPQVRGVRNWFMRRPPAAAAAPTPAAAPPRD